MRLIGLMLIYQKPNTSKAAKGHRSYPYLLKGLRVTRPNQVWAADITYLPMRRGFLYLLAIMDWHTRKVLAWRISNTLEADFCVEALNEAIHRFGPPEIMNTPSRDICCANTLPGNGSGQPIHIVCLDRPPAPVPRAHLDGWHRPVPRQHLRRAAVAEPETRMRLLARLPSHSFRHSSATRSFPPTCGGRSVASFAVSTRCLISEANRFPAGFSPAPPFAALLRRGPRSVTIVASTFTSRWVS